MRIRRLMYPVVTVMVDAFTCVAFLNRDRQVVLKALATGAGRLRAALPRESARPACPVGSSSSVARDLDASVRCSAAVGARSLVLALTVRRASCVMAGGRSTKLCMHAAPMGAMEARVPRHAGKWHTMTERWHPPSLNVHVFSNMIISQNITT